ncbi:3-methyl-2-oxobutanoate hydroxymethyltransferase [Prochlorococcus marinus XMU1419]|uniref:3-methyl-2-oxobutanoate hydroxymethyltransferase n=1 Tax=Prochlorococcus marinus TaxID=1219 RepID=UPI001AD9FCAB|nr:3-methyl-2-oxobutanoate hydroxymethyltransferase [Prochlorococcus marinus]MBO8234318.1 3-methyl-2-oxobutanoate hydroxymethyltransferase [Prochlorococcus marinus XMU1419]MBW3076007.1 3-methyl-2-oxobutanoate hydroxymethyltransferase [Prochlorococcus marinus str. XMU1419]
MLPSELVKYKEKSQKIIALTAWDSISGSIAEQANVDLVLVGDSLAMVCLGHKSTLPLTIENIIYHTNAVTRGFKKKIEDQPLVVSDMPFLTYQCGEDKAVEYAGKIIQSTYAKAIKVEGAEPEIQKVISRLIRMGIPVMGHIGLTPQSFLNQGLKKQGESLESKEKIKKEASILQEIGCFSIVLEHIPELLAKEIQNNLTIPTIGIGAGNFCDGQVRVTADLLGLNDDQPPFCKPIVNGKKLFNDKLKEWVAAQRLN